MMKWSSSKHSAGKLVVVGGQGQRECTSKEVCHLDLQCMTWERASSAQMQWQTVQASYAVMSSSKVCPKRTFSTQNIGILEGITVFRGNYRE
jgi:hypothetical protein